MASILGEESQNVKILGDDEVVFENTQPDPRSASTERRDTAVLGATGQLPEEVTNLRSEVSTRVNETMLNAVTGLQVSDQENFEETADNLASQSAKGGDLVTLGDFFDNSFQAMKNPNLTEAENRATIKYQLTVEKLQDAIEDNAAKTGAGTVANWFDRYILRQMPIGAFEDLTLKSTTVNNEFARAIAGDMPVQDYEVFLDTRINEYLEQGFLFGDNPFALQDLLSAATRLGNDDNAVSDAILGAVDLFPIAGSAVKVAARSASAINRARRVSKALNNIAKSPTASTRAGAIAGPEAATEVAENIAKRTDEPENLASMGPSMADPVSDKAPVRPLGSAAASNDAASEAAKDAYDYVSNALGEIYDKEALGAYITRKVEAIQAKLNKGIINQKLDYTTGRLSVIMGNPRTGLPVTKRTATRYAEDVPEATVVPIDEANNKWAVQIDEVVELDDFVDSSKFENSWKFNDESKGNFLNRVGGVAQKAFTKVFGNPLTAGAYLRDNANLTNLVNRGESGSVRLTQLSAPMLEKIGKVSGSDFEKIGDILARLQSGDAASTRTWFTDDQFIDLWKADNKGKMPSQKVMDAYRASVNLSDYNYIVRSTELVKSLHREGYRRISVVVGGEPRFLAGKKLSDIADDEVFLDARSGATFTKADYDGPLANIFEIDMDVNGVKYVVDTDVVKPLEFEDAMGYNAGGPRINPTATEFVVLLDETGKPINVVLSASSPKTSRLAAQQMDALFVAAKADNLTDDIVQANNKWNTSLETRDDVLKWFEENNIDYKGTKPRFTTKARDENVFTGVNASVFVPNGSLEDFYTFTNKRNDNPLTHFGNGSATVNDNPLRGILNQTNTVNRSLAFSKYNDAAKVSLGQKIKQIADPDSTNKNYRSYYDNIQSWLPEDSSNDVVRSIYERKRITDLRLGGEGFGDRAVTRLAEDASNLIYDLTGKKYNPGNPTHFLTNYGFKSTFLGDPFQTFLQSAQSASIVAMAGLDDGLSGMVMSSNLLKSLKLDGKPLDLFMDGFAKHFGYTKQEATDLRQLFIDMARYEVDPSNLVEGFQTNSRPSARSANKTLRVAGNTVNKAWEKTNNAGMYFFNKGEQITRVTAFGAAARKWGNANKGKSFVSEEARSWISNKEQAYTLNMTNMSRAQIQQGVLRVPTQFYSFMLRAFEGIFVGKDLTPSERMKLAVMMGPFWGTTGMGISNAVPTVEAINSYLPEDYQIEPGSDSYRLVKNGAVDALFAWAAGDGAPETAVASRVGLGDGVVSTLRNYRDGSFIEQLSGAGGGKTGDTLVDFAKALGAMKRGDPIKINEEVLDLFRNFKFIDIGAKVIGMIQHNAYISKSGGEVDFKFNKLDILFTGLGIPLEEVQQVYDSRTIMFNNQKVFRAYSKEIDKSIDGYWRAVLNEKDSELADQYMASIEISISHMTGLPPEQIDMLRTQVFRGWSNTTTFENVQKLRRMGLYTEAQQLLETTK
tara:strand:+ start:765 stop:5180 length:4416 start_codon:yes stop_codon:yes gene_type:complete